VYLYECLHLRRACRPGRSPGIAWLHSSGRATMLPQCSSWSCAEGVVR
jgi:hypothetical protein